MKTLRHLTLSALLACTLCLAGQPATSHGITSYTVNPRHEQQTIEGWGVSLCWWANMCGKWSDDKIDEILTWLTSPDGLNYNIFRYNIGGGDDPRHASCEPHHMAKGKGLRAEMEGFKDAPEAPYSWERDAAQRKIMLKIREKRPDAIFEAFSNSCPYYMTVSGCCGGNQQATQDNLRSDCYTPFAQYLTDVCRHYKDTYGLEFRTLDPFNEPMTDYWYAGGTQEGCHFDVESQIAFIKTLHPLLKKAGLSTQISASDETSVAQTVCDMEAFISSGILPLIGQINTHSYKADNKARRRLHDLCKQHNKPLWMSEVGDGGWGIAGNLKLAQKLFDDMNVLMPKGWVDWQYVEEDNDQWCMVRGNFGAQSYERVKNFYVRQHCSKYLKQGYVMLRSTNPQTLLAKSAAADQIVIVALNTTDTPKTYKADLSAFRQVGQPAEAVITNKQADMAAYTGYTLKAGQQLYYTLPPLSIVTMVIPVAAP